MYSVQHLSGYKLFQAHALSKCCFRLSSKTKGKLVLNISKQLLYQNALLFLTFTTVGFIKCNIWLSSPRIMQSFQSYCTSFSSKVRSHLKRAQMQMKLVRQKMYQLQQWRKNQQKLNYYLRRQKLLFKEANKKCVEAKNQTVAQIPRISDHNKLRTKPHSKNFSNKTMILGRMTQIQ